MSESVSGTHGQGSAPQANTGPGDEVRSSALCLSGGGIRSAAFSIGVLQALHKALGARALPTDTFHFISTVSGGGFAGAWYRAWLHRARLSQQRCAEPSPRQVDAARSPRTPQNGNATGAAKGASQTDVDGTATKDRETRKVREDGGGLEEALQSLRADVGGYLEGSAGDLVLVYLGKLLLFWVFAIPALWTGLLLAAWPASLVVAWAETKNWPATVVVGLTVLLGTAILVALQHPAGRRYVAGATVGGLVFAAAYFLVFGQAHWPLSSIVATLSLPAALGWLASSSRLSQLRWAVESLGAARLIRLTASLAIVLLFVGLAKALSLCLSLFRVWMRKICLYSLGLWLEQNHLPFGEWVQLHSRPQEEWAAPAFLVLLLAVTLVAGLMQARWVSLAEEYRKHIRKTFGLTCDGKAGAPPVELCQLRDDPQLVINAAVSVNEKVHRQWDERKAAAFAWTPKGHVNLWKVEEELEKNRCARQPDQGRHTGQREREQQTPWLDPRVERFELIETASAVDVDLAIATSAAVAGPRMGSFTARPIGDVVEITPERTAQARGIGVALGAHLLGRHHLGGPSRQPDLLRPRDRGARPRRRLAAHDALDLGRGATREAMGAPSGEQLVERNAEGLDVGGGGDGAAAHLLGGGVLGRHHAARRVGEEKRHLGGFVIEQLRDAEVEELHLAALGHQHVRRLDVVVHDEVAMGELHRAANGAKEPQAIRDRQPPAIAVLGDGQALDVLHHQVGAAVVRHSAVEEPADVRMNEASEDLPLGAKALLDLRRLQAEPHELYGPSHSGVPPVRYRPSAEARPVLPPPAAGRRRRFEGLILQPGI